jgi:hypothetical protein
MSNELHDRKPPITPQPDPISAELERALFKRFWSWLAIVGSVVIVVVSGVSVIVAQAVNYIVSERVDTVLNKISDLEKRALDSAFKTADAQARSSNAAGIAEAAVGALNDRIKALSDVDTLVKSMQAAAASLATNPQFVKDVTNKLQISLVDRGKDRTFETGEFWTSASDTQVNYTCPDKNVLVGMEWTMRGINSVRTPARIKFICRELTQ